MKDYIKDIYHFIGQIYLNIAVPITQMNFSCYKRRKEKEYIGWIEQQVPKVPKFDSNNLILIDDRHKNRCLYSTHTPNKKKTHSKGDYTKLITIASRFDISDV